MNLVIPAKAGIQDCFYWIPVCTGMTGSIEVC